MRKRQDMGTFQLEDEDLHINIMTHLDPLFLLSLSKEQGELGRS